MLTIVIANPTQLTMVSAVPLDSSGAFLATKVENIGESATTVAPQTNRNRRKIKTESVYNKSGEARQQMPDSNREIVAIFFAPNRCEMTPLTMQESPPDPMIRKESSGILKVVEG